MHASFHLQCPALPAAALAAPPAAGNQTGGVTHNSTAAQHPHVPHLPAAPPALPRLLPRPYCPVLAPPCHALCRLAPPCPVQHPPAPRRAVLPLPFHMVQSCSLSCPAHTAPSIPRTRAPAHTRTAHARQLWERVTRFSGAVEAALHDTTTLSLMCPPPPCSPPSAGSMRAPRRAGCAAVGAGGGLARKGISGQAADMQARAPRVRGGRSDAGGQVPVGSGGGRGGL